MIHIARASTPGRHKFAPVSIRLEPNIAGSHVVWRVVGMGIDHVEGLHADEKQALVMAAAVAARMIASKPPEPVVGLKPRLAVKDGRRVPRGPKPGPEVA
jgi:hypothetical protein